MYIYIYIDTYTHIHVQEADLLSARIFHNQIIADPILL